jgi:hypothetical protein
MADTTYQTTVYEKHGGNEFVIASGGQITGESGGVMDVQDGFTFYFDKTANPVTAAKMKAAIAWGANFSVIGQGAASTVFSVSNLQNSCRVIFLSCTSTMVNGSVWLCSGAILGQMLDIVVRGGSCASGTVTVYVSGVSLVTPKGLDNSKIVMTNSAASYAVARLICTSNGCWSVIGVSSEVNVAFS